MGEHEARALLNTVGMSVGVGLMLIFIAVTAVLLGLGSGAYWLACWLTERWQEVRG